MAFIIHHMLRPQQKYQENDELNEKCYMTKYTAIAAQAGVQRSFASAHASCQSLQLRYDADHQFTRISIIHQPHPHYDTVQQHYGTCHLSHAY